MDPVEQRRLAAVYDALDVMNYRLAVQLCNKALKRTGGSAAATLKALKALALSRSGGSDDEALSLCREVKGLRPTDAASLQALTSAFRTLGLSGEIVDLYAHACAAVPASEELANHWFMAMARIGDFRGCQQAALRLHKSFKDDKYFFWAVMAAYLQAVGLSDAPGAPAARSVLLSLAERMMDKAMADGKILSSEALELLLIVLEAQGKLDRVADLLSGEHSSLIKLDSERGHRRLGALCAVGDWKSAWDLAAQLVETNPDDWVSYEALVRAASKLSLKSETLNLLDNLQKNQISEKDTKSQPKLRGPFLAVMLMLTTSENDNSAPESKSDISESDGSRLADCVLRHLQLFGAALSCFDDLRPFVGKIPPVERARLIETLKTTHPVAATSLPEQDGVEFVRRDIACRKTIRFLSTRPETDAANQHDDCNVLVRELLERYRWSIPLGAGLDERERQPGDDYIVLAAEYLIDNYAATRDLHPLYRAITLLEYGLTRSKFNYQFKLILIRLYFEAGTFQRPLDLATSLDIKQIQMDTLSYLFCDDLEVYGAYNQATTQFMSRSMIYASNERETPEATLQAFKFATFSKIPEFLRFRRKLATSVQRAHFQLQFARTETIVRSRNMSDLVVYLGNIEQEMLVWRDEDLKCVSDNRDFTMLMQTADSDDSLASKIMGEPFPRVSAPWRKIHALRTLLLSRMLDRTIGEAVNQDNVVVLEIELENAIKTTPDSAASVLHGLSRVVHARDTDASELWTTAQAAYKQVVDDMQATGSGVFGLTRALAHAITTVVESTVYVCAALYASEFDPVSGSSGTNAQPKRNKNRGNASQSAVQQFRQNVSSMVQQALSDLESRVASVTQPSPAAFTSQHLPMNETDIKTDLGAEDDHEVFRLVPEFVRRSWTISLRGYSQHLGHLAKMVSS